MLSDKSAAYALIGCGLGFTGGASTYLTGAVLTGGTVAVPAGAGLLSLTPFALLFIPTWAIGKQLNEKYANSPKTLMISHFLLASSYFILSGFLNLAIMAAFVAAVNPFTLPFMIAAGASALVILGLAVISQSSDPKPSRLMRCCSFFQELISSKKVEETPKAEEIPRSTKPFNPSSDGFVFV